MSGGGGRNAATFHPNPDEESEPWIERAALEGLAFRVWHVIFFCLAAFMGIVILVCCCIKIRIPRTKQEIEANYRRKRLVEKFKERIQQIQNQEMDAIDLQRAMEIIQEDYKSVSQHIDEYNYGCDVTNNLRAEPQQPPATGFKKIIHFIRLTRSNPATE